MTKTSSFFRSLSLWVLLALAGGLAAGAAARVYGIPGGVGTVDMIGSLGQLWLNALRMTIIPLVFSLLVTGIASIADAASSGRMAGKAVLWFLLLLVLGTVYGVTASLGLHTIWPIDPEGGRALLASVPPPPEGLNSAPDFGAFIEQLAPANPVRAASEDAILGVVVFAVAFGFAASRLPERQRLPLVGFFEAVAETMIIIVRWVLRVAPLGVFALALGVGLGAGAGIVGTLAHYIAVVSLVTAGVAVICYPLAVIFGRVGPLRFARAAAPAQVVAFSTQSSLATLPVMIDRARDVLGVSTAAAGLVLPLAVAVFRLTSPVANLAVVIYLAQLYGIEPSNAQYVAAMLAAVLISIGTVGLPGQISFFASVAPICLALGVPIELLPLLLAVEVIPDIFRTVGNVTADLMVTRIVGRAPVGEDAA